MPPLSFTHGADDDSLASELLARRLPRTRILREYRVFSEVGSTNTYLMDEARDEDEGLVVLAEHQTAGRGRQGREWVAAARSSVHCSILLRPRLPVGDLYLLTAACALAVRAALIPLVGTPPQIKWPNDVLLEGRKVCGVLAETAYSGREVVVVLGFGVNVHAAPDRAVVPNATCVADHAKRPITLLNVVVPILAGLDALISDLYAGGSDQVWRDWRDALATLGREVEVRGPGGVLRGRAVDVGRDGGLVVELSEGGQRRTIYAGDAIGPPSP